MEMILLPIFAVWLFTYIVSLADMGTLIGPIAIDNYPVKANWRHGVILNLKRNSRCSDVFYETKRG